ncbi:MAG: ABC transporter substrate-binding protein [Flavobacteriales bacterium]|nr:ABC transporter substrate-binding protein [Flavobacteriales bacterium]
MRDRFWWGALTLISCGTPEPDRALTGEWIEHRPDVAQHFTVLLSGAQRRLLVFADPQRGDTICDLVVGGKIREGGRFAVLSTTYLPYITALGRTGQVSGAAHLDKVRDTAAMRLRDLGRITDLRTADGVDREAIMALAPDLVLGYPFGREDGVGTIAGVPYVMVAEYLEAHPLGRAEWLKFFGALLGKERDADSLYAGIAERYAVAKALPGGADRPKVLFGSQWNGQWWVPPSNSYMAQLITDAGGDYVFADMQGKENIAVDMETILARASDADAWGMIAELPRHPRVADFTGGDERLLVLKAVHENKLFLGNTSRSDLFGQAIIEPDIVLAELREIMQPFPGITDPSGRRPKYFEWLSGHIPPPPEQEQGQ